MKWKRFFRWLTGIERFEFDKVVLSHQAMRQITGFAKRSYPLEFSALLGGEIKDKALIITHVIYQQFEASERTAMLHINVPLGENVVGTVHSHPTHNNNPSSADRRFFDKYGYVNFIIAYPYAGHTIACYDAKGRMIQFDNS